MAPTGGQQNWAFSKGLEHVRWALPQRGRRTVASPDLAPAWLSRSARSDYWDWVLRWLNSSLRCFRLAHTNVGWEKGSRISRDGRRESRAGKKSAGGRFGAAYVQQEQETRAKQGGRSRLAAEEWWAVGRKSRPAQALSPLEAWLRPTVVTRSPVGSSGLQVVFELRGRDCDVACGTPCH